MQTSRSRPIAMLQMRSLALCQVQSDRRRKIRQGTEADLHRRWLLGRQYDPNPDVMELASFIAEASRRSTETPVASPNSTPRHAAFPTLRDLRVLFRRDLAIIRRIEIFAPFRHVAVHVVESPRVWGKPSHGDRFILFGVVNIRLFPRDYRAEVKGRLVPRFGTGLGQARLRLSHGICSAEAYDQYAGEKPLFRKDTSHVSALTH